MDERFNTNRRYIIYIGLWTFLLLEYNYSLGFRAERKIKKYFEVIKLE